MTRLPGARTLMSMTSSTVSRLKANALSVTMPIFAPSRIASAAPKAAPEDAPSRSGDAIGF